MRKTENLPQDEAQEKTQAECEQLPVEEEYQPRPRSQRIFAWVLLAILVAGIACYYYWISHRYG